ncbi:hypothetical protein [Apibacter sp. HY039]|uniref:hypothetical protein n=1 Tax=Apibacter sp. HY039 TaxID=2501476 RepID=UPI000FEC205B|nr:hypothetical protein [Apibacter sp. HY039]
MKENIGSSKIILLICTLYLLVGCGTESFLNNKDLVQNTLNELIKYNTDKIKYIEISPKFKCENNLIFEFTAHNISYLDPQKNIFLWYQYKEYIVVYSISKNADDETKKIFDNYFPKFDYDISEFYINPYHVINYDPVSLHLLYKKKIFYSDRNKILNFLEKECKNDAETYK